MAETFIGTFLVTTSRLGLGVHTRNVLRVEPSAPLGIYPHGAKLAVLESTQGQWFYSPPRIVLFSDLYEGLGAKNSQLVRLNVTNGLRRLVVVTLINTTNVGLNFWIGTETDYETP